MSEIFSIMTTIGARRKLTPMDDNKIREAMTEGLLQGIRDPAEYAFSKLSDPESDMPPSESGDSCQAFGEILQKIFTKAQVAIKALGTV